MSVRLKEHRAAAWFGRNLKNLRLLKKCSQADLATRAGIHPITVHKIEAGKMSVSLRIAVDVSYALGATVDRLCTNPRIIEEELCKSQEMAPEPSRRN